MKLPTFDELQNDERQLDIFEHPLDQPLFVAGPPGSGKTVLAVKRAQMLSDGGSSPQIITFNRMLRRLVELLSDGSFSTKTMHSFVGGDYRRRAPGEELSSSFDWDWPKMLSILAAKKPLPKFDHLIIDEGQDLAEGFFRYASKHAATVLTVFADEDQAIGDRRTTLKEIKSAANLPDPKLLQNNHRNSPEISKVAEHFHAGILPAATVQRGTIGSRPQLIRTAGANSTVEMIANWHNNRGGSIGVIVDSNAHGAEIQGLLKAVLPNARIDRYDHDQKNEDLIDVTVPGITLLNRESVKGQEFDSVFVLELEKMIPWQTETMRRTLYMICTRARDYLTLVFGPAALSAAALSQLPGADILERS